MHYELGTPGRIEKVCRSLPPLPATWVRVRMAYCGLCGTDRSHYSGDRPAELPLSLGHEWVAVVEAIGSAVEAFAAGDVVTTDLNFRCGHCRQCAAGRSHLCERGQIGLFTNRGFATRADIHANYLRKCDAAKPVPQLALAEPMSCARHALSLVHPVAAERVLVIGAGGIGMCMAFLLCHDSDSTFEITDLDPVRLGRIDSLVGPRGRQVLTPAGEYDVVLDVSGTVDGLRSACEEVGPGGRLCTMSHLPEATSAPFLLDLLLDKDVTFNLSYLNGEPDNLVRSIELLEGHWTEDWNALLEIRPLDDVVALFQEGPARAGNKIVVDIAASTAGDEIEVGSP